MATVLGATSAASVFGPTSTTDFGGHYCGYVVRHEHVDPSHDTHALQTGKVEFNQIKASAVGRRVFSYSFR